MAAAEIANTEKALANIVKYVVGVGEGRGST